jgi:putative heme transporter
VSTQYSEQASRPGSPRASKLHAALPWLRNLAVVAALVLAGLAGYDRRRELAEAGHLLGRINTAWLVVAIGSQIAAMIAFAGLQRWLLRAGGVNVRLSRMVEITLAANALGTSLPGGAAWSAAWAFGQLRRRGADRVLTVWVLLVAGALASFALFVLVAVGSWISAGAGPAARLWPFTTALAAIPVTAGLVWYAGHRSPATRRALGRAWGTIEANVPGAPRLGHAVAGLMRRLATVQPGPLGWVEAFGLALANWVFDALCLAASLLALHIRVPWADMVFIYALTQVAASLPITPGGVAVVEGSLTVLLTAYGVPVTQALAGALLYRIINFWALALIGWIVWLSLELAIRGGMHSGPHPWSTHTHGPQEGLDTTRLPDRVLGSAPCAGCGDEATRAGAGAGRTGG